MEEIVKRVIPRYARIVNACNDEKTVILLFSNGIYEDPFESIAINQDAAYELRNSLADICKEWEPEEVEMEL